MQFQTRPGKLDNGVPAQVPKWELRAPQQGKDVSGTNATFTPLPLAAGVPRLLAVTRRELAEAEVMGRVKLAARREELVPRHPDTLDTMASLAVTLRELGKHAEAEAMEREVLAARREVLGARHPDTLTAMDNLASTLQAQCKPAEAEAMEREVLAARRELLGPRDPDTLSAMAILAVTLQQLGKHAEAEAMQREVLAARHAERERAGANDPSKPN